MSARKHRAENRSLHGVNEDSSTALTLQSRKKTIFRGTLRLLTQVDPMDKFKSILYFLLALLLALIALASLSALVRALMVQETLPAIESALGTAVITIILSAMAAKLFKLGREQLGQQHLVRQQLRQNPTDESA